MLQVLKVLKERKEKDYYIKYDKYLTEHITNVRKAFEWLNENCSKFFDDTCRDITEQIMFHDSSKYSVQEYEPYALYFNVDKEKYLDDFNKAWLHHQHNNPHHWQYWVLNQDDDKDTCVEMPVNYVIEMIADWWSFSWKSGDLREIFKWYDDHKSKMKLHNKTKALVEEILNEMDKILESNMRGK